MKPCHVRIGAVLSALSFTLGLTGCASAPPAPSEDEFKQMFAQRYVAPFAKGDAAAWATAFAPHAVGLHDRRPADVGQAAIAEFGKMVATHLKIDRFDVTVEQVRINGSWAYTRGSFNTRLLMRSDGKDTGLGGEGKFFLLWERQPDGQWKIIVDMGNRKS